MCCRESPVHGYLHIGACFVKRKWKTLATFFFIGISLGKSGLACWSMCIDISVPYELFFLVDGGLFG